MRCRTRSIPSCHHACVSPVSSRTFVGSLKKIWQDTANTSGSAKPSSSGARKSGATRMSLFNSTTMSFVATRKPAVDPPPNPRFFGSASTLTDGNAALRNSALPSVEPLSTTMISLPPIASTTEGRYFSSKSLPFQFGITTEAPRRSGAVDGMSGLRPMSFQRRSVTASAAIESSRTTGESRIEGSAFRNRFRNAMSLGRQDRAQPYPPPQPQPARRAHQLQLLRRPARLVLQTKRPGGALFEFLLRPVQRVDRRHQVSRLLLHLGRERHLDVPRPLRLRRGVALQLADLRLIRRGGLVRRGLLARQLFLQFADPPTPVENLVVQFRGPAIALLEVGLKRRELLHQRVMIRQRLLEPAVLFRQLVLQQRDVALAFAQHVGHARNVDKRRIAHQRPVRAHSDEEVRLVRR